MSTLEIVTDASIRPFNNGRTFGCAGALSITTGDEQYLISQDTTNNRSELLGVYLGIKMAHRLLLNNPGVFDDVVLYSDSKLAIYGLTQWMDDWARSRDSRGIMYGSNKKPVKNQELYIAILSYLVNNNLKIKFRHCAGHIAPTSVKLIQANEVFNQSNGYYLKPEEIYKISYYNNVIDERTREKLKYVDPNKYPRVDHSNDYRELNKYKFPKGYKKYVG